MLSAASADTAFSPEFYDRTKSPLHLHCGAVACIVKALFGGDIVTGRIKGVQHYWNRLPNYMEIDLTSCQFGGDGFTPLKKGRKVIRKGLTPLRFLLFANRVKEKL